MFNRKITVESVETVFGGTMCVSEPRTTCSLIRNLNGKELIMQNVFSEFF